MRVAASGGVRAWCMCETKIIGGSCECCCSSLLISSSFFIVVVVAGGGMC